MGEVKCSLTNYSRLNGFVANISYVMNTLLNLNILQFSIILCHSWPLIVLINHYLKQTHTCTLISCSMLTIGPAASSVAHVEMSLSCSQGQIVRWKVLSWPKRLILITTKATVTERARDVCIVVNASEQENVLLCFFMCERQTLVKVPTQSSRHPPEVVFANSLTWLQSL